MATYFSILKFPIKSLTLIFLSRTLPVKAIRDQYDFSSRLLNFSRENNVSGKLKMNISNTAPNSIALILKIHLQPRFKAIYYRAGCQLQLFNGEIRARDTK